MLQGSHDFLQLEGEVSPVEGKVEMLRLGIHKGL